MKERVLICGTGRAGTSFLVRLLTRLGYDTGYSPEADGFTPGIRAGCEIAANGWHDPKTWENLPEVVKSPYLSLHLKQVPVPVRRVLIPVRNLDEVDQSRSAIGLDWPGISIPQRDFLAGVLGEAVASCMDKEIPFTLMQFPRHVQDAKYCQRALATAFPDIAGKVDFTQVHASLRDAK